MTTQDEAIAGRYTSVASRFRWERRNADFTFRDDFSTAVIDHSTPTLSLNNDRAVRREIRGLSLNVDTLPSDWEHTEDLIVPVEERLIDGEWIQFPLGVYRLDSCDFDHTPAGISVCVENGADLGILLAEAGPSAPYTVVAGTNYTAAAETILNSLGLLHTLPAVGSAFPLDVTWAPFPESTWLSMLTDLYAGINYYSPWADAQGRFTTRKRLDPSTETATLTYSDQVEPRMIVGDDSYNTNEDPGGKSNRVVVLIDDPRHVDFGFYQRYNRDPSSEVSIQRRGEVLRVLNWDSDFSTKVILNATTAAAIAEFEIRDGHMRGKNAKLVTFPDPRREPHEFYTLNISNVHEEPGTELGSGLWRVHRWQRDLVSGGKMTHEVGNATTLTVSTT
jgi:hypothetical protein